MGASSDAAHCCFGALFGCNDPRRGCRIIKQHSFPAGRRVIMIGSKYAALMFAAGLMILAASSAQAEPSRIAKIQAALDAWLAERGPVEKVTGVAAYISFGDSGPAIEAFAGSIGSGPGDAP